MSSFQVRRSRLKKTKSSFSDILALLPFSTVTMVHKERDMALVTSYPKERLEIFGRLAVWFLYLRACVRACVDVHPSAALQGDVPGPPVATWLATVAQVCVCYYLYTGLCTCALHQSQWRHLDDCLILVLLML